MKGPFWWKYFDDIRFWHSYAKTFFAENLFFAKGFAQNVQDRSKYTSQVEKISCFLQKKFIVFRKIFAKTGSLVKKIAKIFAKIKIFRRLSQKCSKNLIFRKKLNLANIRQNIWNLAFSQTWKRHFLFNPNPIVYCLPELRSC